MALSDHGNYEKAIKDLEERVAKLEGAPKTSSASKPKFKASGDK